MPQQLCPSATGTDHAARNSADLREEKLALRSTQGGGQHGHDVREYLVYSFARFQKRFEFIFFIYFYKSIIKVLTKLVLKLINLLNCVLFNKKIN